MRRIKPRAMTGDGIDSAHAAILADGIIIELSDYQKLLAIAKAAEKYKEARNWPTVRERPLFDNLEIAFANFNAKGLIMRKLTSYEVAAVLALIDKRLFELGNIDHTTGEQDNEYATLVDAYNIIEDNATDE